MWRNMVETIGGRPILGTPFVGLLAEQILAETATGTHGAGLLHNDGLVAGKRYRLVLQGPFGADGVVYENGSFSVTAPASVSYLLYEDNVLVSSTPTTVTVGTFEALAASVAGVAAYSITATGSVSVTLGSAPEFVGPITLEEARKQCRIAADDTSEDALLAIYIDAAREMAEHELCRVLIARQIVQKLPAFPAGPIRLERPMALEVSAVQYVDASGEQQTLSPSAYMLDNAQAPNRLLPAPGTSWPPTAETVSAVTINYVAGYGDSSTSIPAAVRQWLLLTVGALYAQREAVDASGRVRELPARFVDRLLDPERVYA